MKNDEHPNFGNRKVSAKEIEGLRGGGQTVILRGCDLNGLNLSQLDLSGWNFEKCSLVGCSFNGAVLERAVFLGCRASGSSFLIAILTEAVIDGGDFSNSSFRGATLASTRMAHCKMVGADLSETKAMGLEVEDVLFTFGLLPKMSFFKMTLKQIDFSEADLRSCNFRETVFEECSLKNANLTDCRFERADLRSADLGGVKLTDAKRFKGATISKRQAADLLSQLGLQVQ